MTRRARFHLVGPPPFGCSLHTSDKDDVRRALDDGWKITRIGLLPADSDRLAALVADRRVA